MRNGFARFEWRALSSAHHSLRKNDMRTSDQGAWSITYYKFIWGVSIFNILGYNQAGLRGQNFQSLSPVRQQLMRSTLVSGQAIQPVLPVVTSLTSSCESHYFFFLTLVLSFPSIASSSILNLGEWLPYWLSPSHLRSLICHRCPLWTPGCSYIVSCVCTVCFSHDYK